MEIEKILEVVKLKYKDAYIINNSIKFGLINIPEYKEYSFQEIFIHNNIIINNYYDKFTLKCCSEYHNFIELKYFLGVKLTFEDIKDWVDGLELVYIDRNKYNIFIKYKGIEFIYEENGNVEVNNYQGGINIFNNLTMFELYNQIKLKIENIIKNKE